MLASATVAVPNIGASVYAIEVTLRHWPAAMPHGTHIRPHLSPTEAVLPRLLFVITLLKERTDVVRRGYIAAMSQSLGGRSSDMNGQAGRSLANEWMDLQA